MARHHCNISLKGAVLPGRNDAEMGSANSLHASAYYSEYNERFDRLQRVSFIESSGYFASRGKIAPCYFAIWRQNSPSGYFAASAKIAPSLILTQTLTLNQTLTLILTLIPTLTLTLTQTRT